jgi:hypothetical protein
MNSVNKRAVRLSRARMSSGSLANEREKPVPQRTNPTNREHQTHEKQIEWVNTLSDQVRISCEHDTVPIVPVPLFSWVGSLSHTSHLVARRNINPLDRAAVTLGLALSGVLANGTGYPHAIRASTLCEILLVRN